MHESARDSRNMIFIAVVNLCALGDLVNLGNRIICINLGRRSQNRLHSADEPCWAACIATEKNAKRAI